MLIDTKDVVRVDTLEGDNLQRSQIIMCCGCIVTLRADGVCLSQVICGPHVRRDCGPMIVRRKGQVRYLNEELATR